MTVYDIGGIKKTRLKAESNFTTYETVQHNKYIVCMKLIISQFLSTLVGRKRVIGYAHLPGNSISHVR